ncbi:MAG: DMT family transporter [Cellvibrionaceae bacterium]
MTSIGFFPRPISIAIMLFAATLFASNHVAARFAFDDGAGLVLALVARSAMAFFIMLGIVVIKQQSITLPKDKRHWQLILGILIAVQSLTLYASVAIIPVAVSLLLINTWPIMYTLLNWWVNGVRPSLVFVIILLMIISGLVLVLDVPQMLADPSALGDNWLLGVALASVGAVFLALAMWVTNQYLPTISGAVRSAYTMLIVTLSLSLAGFAGLIDGGFSFPQSTSGWMGVFMLALCYGVASTILFTLVTRLDMARNAPVVNFEPVASLFLAYVILGQMLTAIQLLGGTVVLAGIVWLSLSRRV